MPFEGISLLEEYQATEQGSHQSHGGMTWCIFAFYNMDGNGNGIA